MKNALQKIYDCGIVPVIALEDAGSAVPLARALEEGGLPVAEVTFRTAAAEESIRRMAAECPNVLVGAGTVLNVEQAGRAIKAGAKFIVSPGFSAAVVKFCQDQQVPVTPGVITPTEITAALDMGVEVVKFFPADAFGGIKTIKALAAPFGKVKFIPTGGVNADNLAEFKCSSRFGRHVDGQGGPDQGGQVRQITRFRAARWTPCSASSSATSA